MNKNKKIIISRSHNTIFLVPNSSKGLIVAPIISQLNEIVFMDIYRRLGHPSGYFGRFNELWNRII